MAEQRVQRRLAAILATDVVDYRRFMREDETGTLARLKLLWQEVGRRLAGGWQEVGRRYSTLASGITLGITSLAPSDPFKVANPGLLRLDCGQFPNVAAF